MSKGSNPSKKTLIKTYGACAKQGKKNGIKGEELVDFVARCMLEWKKPSKEEPK